MEKVLLIENDEGVRRAVVRTLVKSGHAVVETSSAEDAVGILDESFDLIITNWDLGAMSGPEFIRFVRGKVEAYYELVPILLITGKGEDDAREALEAGATAVLHKPFSVEDLKKVVEGITN